MSDIFRKAAVKALGKDTIVITSIMRNFKDEIRMAESETATKLKTSRPAETNVPRDVWRWSSSICRFRGTENHRSIGSTTEPSQTKLDGASSGLSSLSNLPQADDGDLSDVILAEMALIILEMRGSEPTSAVRLDACSAEIVALRNLVVSGHKLDFDAPKFHFFVRTILALFGYAAQKSPSVAKTPRTQVLLAANPLDHVHEQHYD